MIYYMRGHALKHAVEEMLLHLLPLEMVIAGEPDDGDVCISTLVQQGDTVQATAQVKIGGMQYEKTCTISIETPDDLGRKRAETEAVKTSIYDAVVQALPEPPVWGSLTGVRPAKLVRGMLARGMTRGQAATELRERFHVSRERTALTLRAAATAVQMDTEIADNEVSLYIGIPFCPSRCYYCSFVCATTAQTGHLIPEYLRVLCGEIAQTAQLIAQTGRRVKSIYIGGGTPTTLDAAQMEILLAQIASCFDVRMLREYTVEAGRPDTITREVLSVMRRAGVDRISINPQSMSDAVLEQIGRKHTVQAVYEAFGWAREMGFPYINMDVIAGLSGDCVEGFRHTIDALIALAPENITVHTLAVKRGADLVDKAENINKRNMVSAMLAYAEAALPQAGYGPYYLYRQKFSAGGFENVGWCKPGTECFYNVAMMEELQTILSVGAGGVSKTVDRETGWIARKNNPKYPMEYIAAEERLLDGKRKLMQ